MIFYLRAFKENQYLKFEKNILADSFEEILVNGNRV